MGPAPSLATYESAAQAEYQPQLQADQTTAAATHQANLNTLQTQLGGVGGQYDIQEQQLTSTVQQEAAQISQTYSQHLLGNFSGLQGNDMGEMFSKANLQEQDIESQRTNAINAINTQIGNENLTYNADQGALTSKYQGLEEAAAQSGYADATKEYDTEAYQQEQLGLNYAKLNQTASYDNADLALKGQTAQNAITNQYKAKASATGLSFTGPNGQAVNLGTYAKAISGGDSTGALTVIRNELSASHNSTDKAALNYLNAQVNKYGSNSDAVLSALANKKDYVNLFNGM